MLARTAFIALIALSASAYGQTAPAEAAPPKPQPPLYFEPPPMPAFMLKKPAAPLTQEEMARQAEEAAARVRKPKPEPQAAEKPR